MLRARVLLGLAVSTLLACETQVLRDPNCEAAPSCDVGEAPVDTCSNQSCHEVELCGASILCESPDPDCLAEPVCDPMDVQVTTCETTNDCYEVTTCGTTILCAPNCEGLLDCDPGDVAVAACNDDSVCYTVEVCGELVVCVDDLLPAHGCPFSEPVSGAACDGSAPLDCSYPNGDDCFTAYGCEQGAWTFVGGGCGAG